MSGIEFDTKMSESVQTETITKPEKNETDSPSTAKKNSILRHRKIPSADLNNVSIFFIIFLMNKITNNLKILILHIIFITFKKWLCLVLTLSHGKIER